MTSASVLGRQFERTWNVDRESAMLGETTLRGLLGGPRSEGPEYREWPKSSTLSALQRFELSMGKDL